MIRMVMLCAFLVGALFGMGDSVVDGQDRVTVPGAEILVPDPSLVPEDPPEELICEPEPEGTPQLDQAAECSRCPSYAPQCRRDRDCDKFCGGKGLGACVPFNSCYTCCACAA